jgi:uncharacterized damage-inducible protein DinB
MPAGKPAPDEYSAFNPAYVSLVPETEVSSALTRQPDELRALLAPVNGHREHFRYASGKWSVREVVGHIIDVERVFGHRAFSIARADPAPLPGFDENAYAQVAHADDRPLSDLLEEFAVVRRSNLFVLQHASEEEWMAVGIANNARVSVRALAFLLVGHVRHHMGILESRYLAPLA